MIDGVYSCKPSKLLPTDLVRFDDKCSNLRDRNITRKNINRKIRDVEIINLPYGGIDIDSYWAKWLKLNNSGKKINLLQ